MNENKMIEALALLGQLMKLETGGSTHKISLIVCGGAALVARNLVQRVTKDVDVLALLEDETLISPAPLPDALLSAAEKVAVGMNLPVDWLNNGPSSGAGGLFQVGLPEGIETRWEEQEYGEALSVYFVGRLDQICFKLYAAVDQMGSYHGQDLAKLMPNTEELRFAIDWVKTHDSSAGFLQMLELYLKENNHEGAVQYI
ncbi:MAG: hypothetical protein ACI9E1_002067 [Cryomorphaceae bacterium]|jgi:hypothetical protein